MTKGIDVSVWNGEIDWGKAAKEVDFAVLRIGYGKIFTQKDTSFEKNYEGCKENGVKVGGYWYNYATTVEEAKAEARVCLAIVGSKKFDMPIWYDIEEGNVLATGKENVSVIAEAFLSAVVAAGHKGGIYMSKNAMESCLTDSVKKKYDLWLAHVGKDGEALEKTSYIGKKNMWQYGWKGKINGINGDVDLDLCYKQYWEENAKPVEEPKEEPKPKPVENTVSAAKPEVIEPSDVNVVYDAFIGRWLGDVTNCEDETINGYAGIENHPINAISAYITKGKLRYRVHVRGGKWLSWVERCDKVNWAHGIAGIKGRLIDGIQFELSELDGYEIQYRVSVIGRKDYLPWVTKWDNTVNGYAGEYGNCIDKIQVRIIKAANRGEKGGFNV